MKNPQSELIWLVRLKLIAKLKLEGYTVEEIATELKLNRLSIERKQWIVRRLWNPTAQ